MAKQQSRFGFGQFAGLAGVALLAVSTSRPWLEFDLAAAFEVLLRDRDALAPELAQRILFVGSNGQVSTNESPQVIALARELGVGSTGWAQDPWLAGAVILAAVVALLGVVRSVLASTAPGARANAPLLGIASLATLVVMAMQLWLLSPEPQAAMGPGDGVWFAVGGAVALMLGAITLGSNRRGRWNIDDEERLERRQFDNTEHLAYSHGAWVPRNPGDRSGS